MLLAWTLTCLVALILSTLLLLALGRHFRVSSRILGILVVAGLVVASGQLSARIWQLPSSDVIGAEALLAGCGFIVVFARPRWNPTGQIFFGSFLGAAIAYLAFAARLTFDAGLSAFGVAASTLLLCLEVSALTISAYFTFESLDVTTRTRTTRRRAPFDPAHQPRVSLQVAAYNEPSDMLIETIQSLEAIDYPNLDILIIDNNTQDPDTWGPVADYCQDRPRVRFVHVDNVEGYKAGALNLSLRSYTDPDAELVGIVDADYLVDPDYLTRTVGFFVDPNLAFLQTPQDYRDYEGDAYLTACYDAYRYFFATSMPSRNERNSIIFAGTMGLIRRSALEQLQGWDEWCITEDAEASLRLLKAGYSGLYLNRSFGRGIMPLTFSALKSQRFRWCFGGIQILRKHLGDLVPWGRTRANRLTLGQRLDYFFGGVQWFTDLLYLGFTGVLLVTALTLLLTGHVALRPLLGAAVLLPAALIGSGVLRALWALRASTGIGMRRSFGAFANWLSLSWTVSLACMQGLVRSEGVFLRTPKWKGTHSFREAFGAAKVETLLALILWILGVLVALRGHASVFLGLLLVWQGSVYASALFMSWLNVRSDLSAQLERRRRTEDRRERFRRYGPLLAGATAGFALAGAALALFVVGAAHPGTPSQTPFNLPRAAPTDPGPLGALAKLPETLPSLVPQNLRSALPFPVPSASASGASPSSAVPSASSSLPGVVTSPSLRTSPTPLRSPTPSPSTSTAIPTSTVTPTATVSPAALPTPPPAAVAPLPSPSP